MLYDQCACDGGDCPLRARCLRYRGERHGRQDFFGAPPFDPASGECEHFADVAALDPTDEQIRTRAYYLWLAAGKPEGRADEHWLEARRALEATRDRALRVIDR
ncbi:MAG: DUF2934 domain-containing protein [Myxococcales bacterium]|nr:DUF2934 domain-containing protein [Myxococcales bacterium]